MPLLSPMPLFAILTRQQFFSQLGDKWVDDLQDFVRTKLPEIVVIVIGAWALMHVLHFFTNRLVKIAEHHAASTQRLAQTRTVASVMRATGYGFIVFIAVLMILSALSFNLTPLIASASVAGVAIGLAAQTIVKDCLNGILILIEDQYNVGDVIRIAGLSGVVESMSLRKTMVRDADGTLYIIPNSQITTVANLTRDYSVATINVSVDFSAKPDEVIKLLKAVAMSVRQDPTYSPVFLADPTLLGVDAIKGSQVIYPVQLKTLANQQWAALRETQRRIRIALDEHGMLPGDPMRVFNSKKGNLGGPTTEHVSPEEPHQDPTAAPPQQTNPLTGESS